MDSNTYNICFYVFIGLMSLLVLLFIAKVDMNFTLTLVN